jgi:hypothetical protein
MGKNRPALFHWRHFEDIIIVLCVRWYLRCSLNYRDWDEMTLEPAPSAESHHRVAVGAALLHQFLTSECGARFGVRTGRGAWMRRMCGWWASGPMISCCTLPRSNRCQAFPAACSPSRRANSTVPNQRRLASSIRPGRFGIEGQRRVG